MVYKNNANSVLIRRAGARQSAACVIPDVVQHKTISA